MAKSLLDSHDIFCRLADENVNLYGGGPLAMPIRLLVAEDEVQEAARQPIKCNRTRRKKLINRFFQRYGDFTTPTGGYFVLPSLFWC